MSLLLGVVAFGCGRNGHADESLGLDTEALSEAWVSARETGPSALKHHAQDPLIKSLYQERSWRFLLFDPPILTRQGRAVLDICENGVFDGFDHDPTVDTVLLLWAQAESLRVLATESDASDPRQLYRMSIDRLAEAELALIRAWQHWAKNMGIKPDSLTGLTRLFFTDPDSATRAVIPDVRDYRVIRATVCMYTYMPDWSGPDFSLEKGEKLQMGDRGPEVASVQKRLAAEGFYTGEITGVYDSATVMAVKSFQRFHYLDEDGVVGPATLRNMKVSRKTLIKRMKRSLVYWRTTPLLKTIAKTKGTDRWVFRVNIPEFTLHVYKGGQEIQRNKVCVGSARSDTNYTPTVRDTVEFIVINPKWNVPDRIFEEELLEDIYETGDVFEFMQKKRFDVAYDKRKDKMWLVREPGNANALGRVKFLFPNRYNIYLHDTPTKGPFSRKIRAVSHGCIRLQGAIDLAKTILVQSEGWTEAQFQRAMDSTVVVNGRKVHKDIWVKLRHKIPIFVDYVLTGVDPDLDRAVFLPDIYKGYEGKRRTY